MRPPDQRSDWPAPEGARCQTLFPSAPALRSRSHAHARASGARACASPPFGRPPLCRASRRSPVPRARPPADIRGPAVRIGASRPGRRPGPHSPPASHGSLGRPPRRGLHPVSSRPAGGKTRSPEAAGGEDAAGLEGGEAGNVLLKTLLGIRFWLSRRAFFPFQSWMRCSPPLDCVGFCHCFKNS